VKPILKILPLVLLNFCVNAQSSVYLSIQKNTRSYPEKDFYIARVVDKRGDRTSVGEVRKLSGKERHPAEFRKELGLEIENFFITVFPNQGAANQVLAVINEFRVGDADHIEIKDSGYVYLNIDFYRIEKEGNVLLYNYTHRLSEAADDVFLSHANRIKRALLLSASLIESSLKDPSLAQRIPGTPVMEQSITDREHYSDSVYKARYAPSYYFMMLGAYFNFGSGGLFMGPEATILLRLSRTSRVLAGAGASYCLAGFLPPSRVRTNTDISLRNYNFGARVLAQIKKRLFFDLNLQAMFGQEDITEYYTIYTPLPAVRAQTSSSSINGFQVNIGVCSVNPSKSGVTIGGGLFVRASDSDIIVTGLGINFNLGLKF
jgi:hypothetical protein